MRTIHYLTVYVFPFVLMFAGGFLLHLLAQKMSPGFTRAAVNAFIGIFIAVGILLIIQNSLASLRLKPVAFGGFSSLIWGLAIGLNISAVSGIGFGLIKGYPLNFANLPSNLHVNVLANTFPALSEEIVFRGGIVNATTQIAGKAIGLAAGSAPFGILHILGSLFGQAVTMAQIIGITLAGLMLGLVYMQFGIWGAFGCHLAWNSLVGGWVKVYGLEDKGAAISALEGSWITCTVLAVVCAALLIFQLRSRS